MYERAGLLPVWHLHPLWEFSFDSLDRKIISTNKQTVKETKIAEEVEVVLTEVFFCELQAKPLVFYQLEYLDMFLQGQE